MKEKILQLVLNEEVSPDESSAKRSQTTGHLVITMPKLDFVLNRKLRKPKKEKDVKEKKEAKEEVNEKKNTLLEVDEKLKTVNIHDIVKRNGEDIEQKKSLIFTGGKKINKNNNNNDNDANISDEEFVDDDEVPPLE